MDGRIDMKIDTKVNLNLYRRLLVEEYQRKASEYVSWAEQAKVVAQKMRDVSDEMMRLSDELEIVDAKTEE
jgi:hypothetical protein